MLETHDFRDDGTAVIARDAVVDALALCRDDPDLAFDLLVDITAVDWRATSRLNAEPIASTVNERSN